MLKHIQLETSPEKVVQEILSRPNKVEVARQLIEIRRRCLNIMNLFSPELKSKVRTYDIVEYTKNNPKKPVSNQVQRERRKRKQERDVLEGMPPEFKSLLLSCCK